MILRLVQQEGLSEELRPVQIYVYPTYFFTPETAQAVRYFIDRFQTLNVFGLRDWLRKTDFSPGAFLRYEGFLVAEEDLPKSLRISRSRSPKYSEYDHAAFLFFSVEPIVKRRPGKDNKPTETDAWAIPALLAVGLPLLLDVKVVATPSFVPLFPSGADFRETAVLDGPHAFTNHVWGSDRFRVDELEEALIKLLALYDLHLDVFAEGYDPHWPQLKAVAKDVATDPYYVFSYYERKERGGQSQQRKKKGRKPPTFKGIPIKEIERYLEIYDTLGGETAMGIIGKLVDAYAAFYRAKKLDSAYAVLRPLGTATDVIVKSDPRTGRDDLLLLVAGAVNDDIDRVRADQAEGWIPLKTESPEQQWFPLLRQKIEEFSRLCVEDLLYGYCQGDRAMLRERLNRLRSAARFYYLQKYGSHNQGGEK
jgi:CRISPR-associated protein Csc3